MFIHVSDSHVRSVSKAICWRIIGSIDTFLITLLITGSFVSAGSIASLETISKIVLYYLHERAWSKIPFGRQEPDTNSQGDFMRPGEPPVPYDIRSAVPAPHNAP
jgi:uncharacterized membrane protein